MNLHHLLLKLFLILTFGILSACGGGSGGDGSGGGIGSWSIGGQSYNAGKIESYKAFEDLETPSFAILLVSNGSPFKSNVSVSFTLTGAGRYYVTTYGNVSSDEENLAYTKRIGILAQETSSSAAGGFAFYTSAEDSGFIDVTVDGTGKYHFDIPSSSPITLLESNPLSLLESNNTVDFSMNNVFDFR